VSVGGRCPKCRGRRHRVIGCEWIRKDIIGGVFVCEWCRRMEEGGDVGGQWSLLLLLLLLL
jgi:hypothetical protein